MWDLKKYPWKWEESYLEDEGKQEEAGQENNRRIEYVQSIYKVYEIIIMKSNVCITSHANKNIATEVW